MAVFEAITLHASGKPNGSIASLLDVVERFVRTPDIDHYRPAISANAAYVHSL